MRPQITFIKQATTHSVGHVYEHIIADGINNALMAHGHLPLLNYELNANTYDGIIILSLEADNQATLSDATEVLRNEAITEHSVKAAVVQIGSEYERLVHYDMKQLLREVERLHATSWTSREEFTRSNPIDNAARELNSQSIQFGRKATRSFAEFTTTYRIEGCPFELKPLAVYVLQGLAFLNINFMNNRLKFSYDAGDEWAEYQELVGYSHKLRILKSEAPSIDEFRTIEQSQRDVVLAGNFPVKLRKYLSRNATDPIPYFTSKNLYTYSYQFVGHKGWEEIISAKNIDLVIKKLTVQVD